MAIKVKSVMALYVSQKICLEKYYLCRKFDRFIKKRTIFYCATELTGEVKVSQSRKIVMARVSLIKSVCLPANNSATVSVQVSQVKGTVLLEPTSIGPSLQVKESLLQSSDGATATVIVNNSSSSCQLIKVRRWLC